MVSRHERVSEVRTEELTLAIDELNVVAVHVQWMLSVVEIMDPHLNQAAMIEYERVCISSINLAIETPFAPTR